VLSGDDCEMAIMILSPFNGEHEDLCSRETEVGAVMTMLGRRSRDSFRVCLWFVAVTAVLRLAQVAQAVSGRTRSRLEP
jgi:hypothetical protein